RSLTALRQPRLRTRLIPRPRPMEVILAARSSRCALAGRLIACPPALAFRVKGNPTHFPGGKVTRTPGKPAEGNLPFQNGASFLTAPHGLPGKQSGSERRTLSRD